MDNTTIQKFLDEHDYDIRKTHNGRWIDQKCTMDVVCLVSDCIVEYEVERWKCMLLILHLVFSPLIVF